MGIFARKDRVSQIQDLVDLVDQALALDETNSSAHCWKAILSNARSSLAGFKAEFENLETVKYHLQRAVHFDPSNATALNLLGSWHLNMLDLSFFMKFFVNTFWRMPAHCTYEEALELFLKAEQVAPKVSIGNLFLIGKTYFRLNQKSKAKHYMELALKEAAVTDEDQMYFEEAKRFYRSNLAS